MEKSSFNFNISSTSIDENLGTARIIIEGNIPAPRECDDPIVELFRPIRNKYRKRIFFTILTKHTDKIVVCDLVASNSRQRTIEEFLCVAINTLEGGADDGKGVLADYVQVLEQFFKDKDGLSAYLAAVEKAKKLQNGAAATVYAACNDGIKKFVNKIGLTMPSLKKTKKTKAQKRADGKTYLASHPEILKK